VPFYFDGMTYSFVDIPQIEEEEFFEIYENYSESLTETEPSDWSLVDEN
jgi:hypothetical protein